MMSNIMERIAELKSSYDGVFSNNITEVNNHLDMILLELNTIGLGPKFIITRALYIDEMTGDFFKGKFVIRPGFKFNLSISDLKTSFILVNSKNFFISFIDNILEWIEKYNDYVELNDNLGKLNDAILDIINKAQCPYELKFTVGEGIIDITDNSVLLGLDIEVIKNIPSLPLFSDDEFWSEKYIEKFINVLKECNRPYDIVKIKSDITYELGIYNRKSINKLLRKIVSRRIDYVRVGVGYSEDETTFALIERIPVASEDVRNFDIDSVIIMDNDNPTKVEKDKGLTKIITRYKLMPFEKKTNILVDVFKIRPAGSPLNNSWASFSNFSPTNSQTLS